MYRILFIDMKVIERIEENWDTIPNSVFGFLLWTRMWAIAYIMACGLSLSLYISGVDYFYLSIRILIVFIIGYIIGTITLMWSPKYRIEKRW